MKHKIYLIVATDLKGGIGQKGKLPWDLPGDMEFFKNMTIKTEDIQRRNMVVMGRVTWESIPEKHRPLKARKNVVITRNKDFKVDDSVTVAHSIEQALKAADDRVSDIFVIGGAKVFEQFMKKHKIDGIYLTRIKKEYPCDTFFPRIPKNFKPERLGDGKDGDVSCEFLFYKK
jgi:dihydrofolate reductase